MTFANLPGDEDQSVSSRSTTSHINLPVLVIGIILAVASLIVLIPALASSDEAARTGNLYLLSFVGALAGFFLIIKSLTRKRHQ